MRIVLSVVALFFGVFWVRQAIRGRLVSSNPHCGGCKFDLVGLELGRDSVCPECGQPTIPNTPMVSDGLRKRRSKLAALAILLILLGSTGLAWPKISQMPTIKNVDWYAKFPEGLLLKLEAGGDKEALQTIYDRVIAGSLSSEGLTIMIDRAFANEADSTIIWDKQWGEILYQSCIKNQMSDEQLHTYLRGFVRLDIKFRDQVKYGGRGVPVQVVVARDNRYPATQGGSTGYGYRETLMRYGIVDQEPYFSNTSKYYDFSNEIYAKNREGSHSWMTMPYWIGPRHGRFIRQTGSQVHVYIEFDIDFVNRVTMEHVFVDQRREEHAAGVVLTIPYEQVESSVLPEIVSKLTCSPIRVPRDPAGAKALDPKTGRGSNIFSITSNGITEDAGFLGTFWLDNGEEQIKLTNRSLSTLKKDVSHGFHTPYSYSVSGPTWLDYYIEHQAFWDKVIEDQSVTVIYRPDPSMLDKYPWNDLIINQPVVWRDVGIDVLIPGQVNVQRNGVIAPEWEFVNEDKSEADFSYRSSKETKSVQGELLNEE